MKKTLFINFLLIISSGSTVSASSTSWWLQTTICRPNAAQCWTTNTAVDTGMWDATGNCWGIKTICGAALKTNSANNEIIPKLQISSGNLIKPDFDTNELSIDKDCWGVRKTKNNGTEALVGTQYVKVYCNNVLNNSDETLKNGQILTGGTAQPNCQQLADNGYVAVLDGNCYGKYFNPENYIIECNGDELPSRIIGLNGAPDPQYRASSIAPTTISNANNIFNAMRNSATTQKNKYFNK